MVILRVTKKVLRYLPSPIESPGESQTALGDWYLNRIVIDRQPLLLAVSAKSLLTILVPARDVRSIPGRFSAVVADRLKRYGAADELIAKEVLAMDSVVVAKTCDRSVIGTMVDFAKLIPFYLAPEAWNESSLPNLESKLARTPCRAAGRSADVIFPDRKAMALLKEKWAPGDTKVRKHVKTL